MPKGLDKPAYVNKFIMDKGGFYKGKGGKMLTSSSAVTTPLKMYKNPYGTGIKHISPKDPYYGTSLTFHESTYDATTHQTNKYMSIKAPTGMVVKSVENNGNEVIIHLEESPDPSYTVTTTYYTTDAYKETYKYWNDFIIKPKKYSGTFTSPSYTFTMDPPKAAPRPVDMNRCIDNNRTLVPKPSMF